MNKSRDLSVLEKQRLLKSYESLVKCLHREAAAKLNISQPLQAYYRKKMRGRIIDKIDLASANYIAKKSTLLEAVHLLHESWLHLKLETISNCF